MSANAVEVLQYRRALEALRNGVPNRDAVSVMGCAQAEIEQRFRQNLELTQESLEKDKQAPRDAGDRGFRQPANRICSNICNIWRCRKTSFAARS